MNSKYLVQNFSISGSPIKGPLVGIDNLSQLTNKIVSFLIPLAGVILLFVIIWGGYDFLMSQGTPEKIKSARAKLTSGIIGFTLLVFSYLIVKLIAWITGLRGGLF